MEPGHKRPEPTARNRVLYELFRLDPDPPTSLRRLAEIVSSPVSN